MGETGLGSRRGRADIHIHSADGDALPTVEQILEHVEHHTDLDVIAITDHDEIKGAYRARDLAVQKGYRVEVIVGCEITTLDGHLLVLDLETRLPMLKSLERTVEAVRRQGGMCIVPHPMSWLTTSVGFKVLTRITRNSSDAVKLDGIELFNPSMAGRVAHRRARALNRSLFHLAETGGSDAHLLPLVGTGMTIFDGSTAEDLRESLRDGRTRALGRFWPTSAHLDDIASLQLQSMVVHPTRKVKRAIGGVWDNGVRNLWRTT